MKSTGRFVVSLASVALVAGLSTSSSAAQSESGAIYRYVNVVSEFQYPTERTGVMSGTTDALSRPVIVIGASQGVGRPLLAQGIYLEQGKWSSPVSLGETEAAYMQSAINYSQGTHATFALRINETAARLVRLVGSNWEVVTVGTSATESVILSVTVASGLTTAVLYDYGTKGLRVVTWAPGSTTVLVQSSDRKLEQPAAASPYAIGTGIWVAADGHLHMLAFSTDTPDEASLIDYRFVQGTWEVAHTLVRGLPAQDGVSLTAYNTTVTSSSDGTIVAWQVVDDLVYQDKYALYATYTAPSGVWNPPRKVAVARYFERIQPSVGPAGQGCLAYITREDDDNLWGVQTTEGEWGGIRVNLYEDSREYSEPGGCLVFVGDGFRQWTPGGSTTAYSWSGSRTHLGTTVRDGSLFSLKGTLAGHYDPAPNLSVTQSSLVQQDVPSVRDLRLKPGMKRGSVNISWKPQRANWLNPALQTSEYQVTVGNKPAGWRSSNSGKVTISGYRPGVRVTVTVRTVWAGVSSAAVSTSIVVR